MVEKKLKKGSGQEYNDLGNRNFMLPSYHKKTHFKAATHIQLNNNFNEQQQIRMKEQLGIMNYDKGLASSADLSDSDQGRGKIE